MANLNWDEITQEQIDKIVEKIKSYLGEENEVCRVGWALKVVLPNKIGQPNVLKKLAVRVCKTGEYRYDRSSSFQYDFDIVKVPDTEIRSFNLDRKYKEFLWKYRVTPWILSTLGFFLF